MANLYHVHKFGIRIKEVRSFPPRKKTDRNLFYNRSFFWGGGGGRWLETPIFVSHHTFPNFDCSLDLLTASSDSLEVSIIHISIVTLPSTVLKFPKDMDFLLSALIVFHVALWFFLSFLFSKRYSFKDFALVVDFSISFSFALLPFFDR